MIRFRSDAGRTLLIGAEGLAALAALMAVGGWRLTAARSAFAGLAVLLTVLTLFLTRKVEKLGAASQLRLIFLAAGALAAAVFPFFYYDNPEVDRVAAYFRQAAPVSFLVAVFSVQIAYISGKAERAGHTRPVWVRARSVWERALIVLAVLIVMSAYLPIRRNYYPSNDSSIFSYIGSVIRAGGLPYVDAWDHKPPLIFYLNALGLALSDGRLIGVWILETVFLTAAMLSLYRTLLTALPERVALPVVFFRHDSSGSAPRFRQLYGGIRAGIPNRRVGAGGILPERQTHDRLVRFRSADGAGVFAETAADWRLGRDRLPRRRGSADGSDRTGAEAFRTSPENRSEPERGIRAREYRLGRLFRGARDLRGVRFRRVYV